MRGRNGVALTVLASGKPAAAEPFAYITNVDDNTVTVIDTATLTVIATVPVGNNPEGIAAGAAVYVSDSTDDTVSVIDTTTNTVTATVPVGAKSHAFGAFIGPGWVGSRMAGLAPTLQVICSNRTTRQRVRATITDSKVDCAALGLAIEAGDRLAISVTGTSLLPGGP